jgi:hypothetical protein
MQPLYFTGMTLRELDIVIAGLTGVIVRSDPFVEAERGTCQEASRLLMLARMQQTLLTNLPAELSEHGSYLGRLITTNPATPGFGHG